MKVLALESATLSGGAALVDGERLLGEVTLDVAVTHSERLMAAVDRLVADCGLSPHDLDGLAVSIGPGSFTGLRVGIATAKGLGLALDLPIAAVPTPAVVAQLGRRALEAGEGWHADDIAPLYLRPSEAELKARRTS